MKTKAGPGCTAVRKVSLAELWRDWGHGQKAAWELWVCLGSVWPLLLWDGELPSAFHHFSLSPMKLRKEGLKQKPGQVKFSSCGWQTKGKKRKLRNCWLFFCILCHVWFAHSPPQIQVPPSVLFPGSLTQLWPAAASPSPKRSSGAALSTREPIPCSPSAHLALVCSLLSPICCFNLLSPHLPAGFVLH